MHLERRKGAITASEAQGGDLMETMEQPCWSCVNFSGGCEWTEYQHARPVPGWKVKEYDIVQKDGRIYHRFYIVECPKYEMDERSKKIAEQKSEYKKNHEGLTSWEKRMHWTVTEDGMLECEKCHGKTSGNPSNHLFCSRCGRRMYGTRKK